MRDTCLPYRACAWQPAHFMMGCCLICQQKRAPSCILHTPCMSVPQGRQSQHGMASALSALPDESKVAYRCDPGSYEDLVLDLAGHGIDSHSPVIGHRGKDPWVHMTPGNPCAAQPAASGTGSHDDKSRCEHTAHSSQAEKCRGAPKHSSIPGSLPQEAWSASCASEASLGALGERP